MSGASDAVEALRKTAQEAYRRTFAAGTHLAATHTAVRRAEDIVEVMARTIDLIVAVEALHDAADAAVAQLRETLAAQMQTTGATTVQGTHHGAHLAKKPQFVVVEDEKLIPRSYYVQPPAALDKKACKKDLKNGVAIAGASLATPNSMTLVLTAKDTPQP